MWFDSLLFQFLARFDRLSPCSGLLLLLDRLYGAGRGILLHGREWVDGVEEGGDFRVGGQLGAICAQMLFQCDFEVNLLVALDAVQCQRVMG